MPPIEYTRHTNNEEVAAIYEQYRIGDAPDAIDWDAMEADIIDGHNDYNINIEDLVTAYALGRHAWTRNIMAPESFIDDPDAFPLWEVQTVRETLEDLRDDFPRGPDGMGTAIDHFLAFADANGGHHTEGVLAEINRLIAEMSTRADDEDSGVEEGAAATQAGSLDLRIPEDFEAIKDGFWASGNISMVLLLQFVYQLGPMDDKVIDTAVNDAMEKNSDELKKQERALGRLDGSDPESGLEAQQISLVIDRLKTVNQVLAQLVQALQEMKSEWLKMTADTADSRNQTIEFMIARM